jgi:hypothetical protein
VAVRFHADIHSVKDLTVHAGVDIPKKILTSPTLPVFEKSLDMVNNDNKTWSRSTGFPVTTLVHSESGNCGQLNELTMVDLTYLGSQLKFSRAERVCLSDGDKLDSPCDCNPTQ